MAIKVLDANIASNLSTKDSIKNYTLNFVDIVNNNSKFYSLEVVLATDGNYYLFSCYGRLGREGVKEYRACDSLASAEKEAEKIIKSKLKKGYVKVDLIAKSVGSEIVKSKIEVSENDIKKLGIKVKEEKSYLNPKVQDLVRTFFGSIEQFVVENLDTSKCALGQLSIEQINKGRDLLLEARKIVLAGANDISELNSISSKYYSNIPIAFGGKRLNVDQLRFDNNDKLDKAFDMLDGFENAKNAENIIKRNSIDEKYASLKTEIEWIDPKDTMFKWIDTLFHKTRASNHHFLGKLKINNIYKLTTDKEYSDFMGMAEEVSGKKQKRKELPDAYKDLWKLKPKESSSYEELCLAANILPLWHGTNTNNFHKILSSKLLMRKPGFTVSGSMFDKNGGIYFASNSSKSLNYSSLSGSYWSNGNSNSGFLFLSDVILGSQEIAKRAHPYTLDNIKPNLSVWAKAGGSVINDEMIVFTEKQNWLKYIIEVVKI